MQASRQKDTDHSTRVSPSPNPRAELKAGDRGFEERKTPRGRGEDPTVQCGVTSATQAILIRQDC